MGCSFLPISLIVFLSLHFGCNGSPSKNNSGTANPMDQVLHFLHFSPQASNDTASNTTTDIVSTNPNSDSGSSSEETDSDSKSPSRQNPSRETSTPTLIDIITSSISTTEYVTPYDTTSELGSSSETSSTEQVVTGFTSDDDITPISDDYQTNDTSGEGPIEVDVAIEEETDDESTLDVENSEEYDTDEEDIDLLLFSKVVRVNKVEEVFEDLALQNVHRTIHENRIEKIELSQKKEREESGTDIIFKSLISM